MPAAIDLTGREFGQLTALQKTNQRGVRVWECLCRSCGEICHFTTARLNSGRVAACPTCSGARVRSLVDRPCVICGVIFQADGKSEFCSSECRNARRRGLKAGVDQLPRPMRDCEICGQSFHLDRGDRKTCSDICLKERRRRKALINFRLRVKRDPDLSRKMNHRRRERARNDPEYATKITEWERNKYQKHRERMRNDPEYAAKHRERGRQCYQRNADLIQTRRRERLMELPEEQLAELAERMRRYNRHHRQKRRLDPIKHARDEAIAAEWRRRRNAGAFTMQASQLLAAASARLDDPARIKPCLECGRPIVGRKAQALTCSDECGQARVDRQIKAGRAKFRKLASDRTCSICATPIDPSTCRITCSEPCRKKRKLLQKHQYKNSQNRNAENE